LTASVFSGLTANVQYDAVGQRKQKTVNGKTTTSAAFPNAFKYTGRDDDKEEVLGVC
jgi:hypothetical protein